MMFAVYFLFFNLIVSVYSKIDPHSREKPHEGNNLVINVGLPKSGTESLHFALTNVGIRSGHYYVDPKLCSMIYPIRSITVGGHYVNETIYPRIDSGTHFYNSRREPICSLAIVMQHTISKNKPPLFTMINDGYRGFAELDYIDEINDISIFPMFEMIDELFKYYPKAHYVHTRRVTPETHVSSMSVSYHILEKLKKTGWLNKFPEQSNSNNDFDNGVIFVKKVTNITISAFKKRPDIRFLDLCIDCPGSDNTKQLRNFLGVNNLVYSHTHSSSYDDKNT